MIYNVSNGHRNLPMVHDVIPFSRWWFHLSQLLFSLTLCFHYIQGRSNGEPFCHAVFAPRSLQLAGTDSILFSFSRPEGGTPSCWGPVLPTSQSTPPLPSQEPFLRRGSTALSLETAGLSGWVHAVGMPGILTAQWPSYLGMYFLWRSGHISS